ncbi:uncharacterized protein LOC141906815 [Tubulanus polymorphus]|uniref:uncharacterized protein LOC141906815 n=1 Tax=Tubulanus polymorphus TaxID=672921 RepID=UPI003DA4B366
MTFSHFVYTWIVLLLVINDTEGLQTKINSAPDGVVLDSVNVLPGTRILLSEEGKTVRITCKQSSSTATRRVQLQVNNGAGGTWTPIKLSISTVWKFVPEAGKQYKCVATNSAGTKESKLFKSDVISIKIDECRQLVKSLDCTCKAVSKIGDSNLAVAWYPNGFEDKRHDFFFSRAPTVQKIIENGIINRISFVLSTLDFATAIQCRLSTYNGIKPAKRIVHQRNVDVTCKFPTFLSIC